MESAERTRRCFSCGVIMFYVYVENASYTELQIGVKTCRRRFMCYLGYYQLLYSILVLLEESGNYFEINNVICHV
jgi:hypothetical protein